MRQSDILEEGKELARLRQLARQTGIKERQTRLREFLDNIKKMIRDRAKLDLPKSFSEHKQLILTQPQVFISYAWDNDSLKLAHLQTFLKQLTEDLTIAGLNPWWDMQRMTGALEEQMRDGIRESQYVLLIGTKYYAKRVKSTETNVGKELEFVLKQKREPDFLLPLMFEGNHNTTFPTVNHLLIRDCKSWYSLEQGVWQSQENYIKELTQYEPLGILPCLLGLNRQGNQAGHGKKMRKFRKNCLKEYKEKQQALMNALELLSKSEDALEVKTKPSRPSPPLTPVTVIPFNHLDYDRKDDLIGRGGYGEVYRGQCQEQTVAIKEFTGNLTADAEKNLYQEAGVMLLAAKELKEPSPIVRLYGLAIEKLNSTYALVMEYVPNGTLFALLQTQSKDKLPWDLFYQLAIDIANGIALLHSKDILHRDLRSHNILLTIFDGRLRAKLSDFGLSTVKNSARSSSTRMEGTGTRAWMAPELHKPNGQSSPASDVYSFGMVLWELLACDVPFKNAQDPSLISEWVNQGEREKIPKNCPKKLAELIGNCWLSKPEARPTIQAIQQELMAQSVVHMFSAKTQTIVKRLQDTQKEREDQWVIRRLEKRRNKEQEYEQKISEIKNAEIQKLQQKLQNDFRSSMLTAQQHLQLEKLQLKAEKDAEIEKIRQKHALELKQLKENLSKETSVQSFPAWLQVQFQALQTLVSPLVPTTTTMHTTTQTTSQFRVEATTHSPAQTTQLSPVSQSIQQTFIAPPPKHKNIREVLALQDQLITACRQGDIKAVKHYLNEGAQPEMRNETGEHPLAAAVWGMCPEIVKVLTQLMQQEKGYISMNWEECKQHNKEKYGQTFFITDFTPMEYSSWYVLLERMKTNPFLSACHLKQVNELCKSKKEPINWEVLVEIVETCACKGTLNLTKYGEYGEILTGKKILLFTEAEFEKFRTQIRETVQTAKLIADKAF